MGYAAPQVVTYGAVPQQFVTYAAPPVMSMGQQVVYLDEAGQPVEEGGQVVQADGTVMEAGQVYFTAPAAVEGQQLMYVNAPIEGAQMVEGAEGTFMAPAEGAV